jgi:hypothetical protein
VGVATQFCVHSALEIFQNFRNLAMARTRLIAKSRSNSDRRLEIVTGPITLIASPQTASCNVEVTIQDTPCKPSQPTKCVNASKLCHWPEGCHRFAQGGTKFCISHGGGRICQSPGCNRSAQGARSFFCISHGGGRRCLSPGCTTSARGATGFCVLHGGGVQCKHDGCHKTAQRPTDYCIAHGGGRRCKSPGCNASLRGGYTVHCKNHTNFSSQV